MVKGTYPLILLIDFIKTKEMLIQTKDNKSLRSGLSGSKASGDTQSMAGAAFSTENRKSEVDGVKEVKKGYVKG
jgi:hypothetical protein